MLRKSLFRLLCPTPTPLSLLYTYFLRFWGIAAFILTNISQGAWKVSGGGGMTSFFGIRTLSMAKLILIIKSFINPFLFLNNFIHNFNRHFNQFKMITLRCTSFLAISIIFISQNVIISFRMWSLFIGCRYWSFFMMIFTYIYIFMRL